MCLHLFSSYFFDTHCVRSALGDQSNHEVGDLAAVLEWRRLEQRLSFPLPLLAVKALAPHYRPYHVGLSVYALPDEPG